MSAVPATSPSLSGAAPSTHILFDIDPGAGTVSYLIVYSTADPDSVMATYGAAYDFDLRIATYGAGTTYFTGYAATYRIAIHDDTTDTYSVSTYSFIPSYGVPYLDSQVFPYFVPYGTSIGSTMTFSEPGLFHNVWNYYYKTGYGFYTFPSQPWYYGLKSYIGFKFTTGASSYYGWISMLVGDGTGYAGYMKFYGVGFDDSAGTAILAGATAVVPEPGAGALAALALGAGGIASWRRRRRDELHGEPLQDAHAG